MPKYSPLSTCLRRWVRLLLDIFENVWIVCSMIGLCQTRRIIEMIGIGGIWWAGWWPPPYDCKHADTSYACRKNLVRLNGPSGERGTPSGSMLSQLSSHTLHTRMPFNLQRCMLYHLHTDQFWSPQDPLRQFMAEQIFSLIMTRQELSVSIFSQKVSLCMAGNWLWHS